MPLRAERVRSRHPFQIYMLCVTDLSAVLGVVAPDARPNSLTVAVGHTGALICSIFLACGATLALVGIWWRDRPTGLVMEAGGCLAAGFAVLYYALAALMVVGGSATVAAGTLAGFGAACIVRARQIRRVLDHARRLADDVGA